MKALTLTQPWASLVALGAKHFETRSWKTNHRGAIAIHAAKGLKPIGGKKGLFELVEREPFWAVLANHHGRLAPDLCLPLGAIVAVCELVYCLPAEEVRQDLRVDGLRGMEGDLELAFGDFSDGRHAWRLASVQALEEPIPCRGALGLWEVPFDELDLNAIAQLVTAEHRNAAARPSEPHRWGAAA